MYVALKPAGQIQSWTDAFTRHLPEAELATWEDADRSAIEYLVAWHVRPDRLASMPKLKAVLLVGAGYDHLDLDAFGDVAVIRLTDPEMAQDMALYCLSWVIHFQRDFDTFARHQSDTHWEWERSVTFPNDYRVGILGQGTIGSVIAQTCEHHGFPTLGWSRSANDRPLLAFFEACDLVINVLPSTDSTHHLVGAAELAALGDGVLVNIGRGSTVDAEALIVALDNNLRAAVLDVFPTEPLPKDSPLWRHPRLTVTPHIAGRTSPYSAAQVISNSIRAVERGEQPAGRITS